MNDSTTGRSLGEFIIEYRAWLILLAFAILSAWLAKSYIYAFSLKADVLQFSNLVAVLGPAFVAALLVERAVEVVIAGTRGGDQNRLDVQVETAELSGIDKAEVLAKVASFKTGTLHMAIGFNLAFAFLLSLAGVRILAQFFEIPLAECMPEPILTDPEECPNSLAELRNHYHFFVGVDLLVTTFVIAGGSEGLHSIVNAITKFAKQTSASG